METGGLLAVSISQVASRNDISKDSLSYVRYFSSIHSSISLVLCTILYSGSIISFRKLNIIRAMCTRLESVQDVCSVTWMILIENRLRTRNVSLNLY